MITFDQQVSARVGAVLPGLTFSLPRRDIGWGVSWASGGTHD